MAEMGDRGVGQPASQARDALRGDERSHSPRGAPRSADASRGRGDRLGSQGRSFGEGDADMRDHGTGGTSRTKEPPRSSQRSGTSNRSRLDTKDSSAKAQQKAASGVRGLQVTVGALIIWNAILTVLVTQNAIFRIDETEAVLLGGRRLVIPNDVVVTGNVLVHSLTDTAEDVGRGNVVIGHGHTYGRAQNTLVAGGQNTAEGNGVSVLGLANAASGNHASVLGGTGNTASGPQSSIVGGSGNEASGVNSVVAGGVDQVVSQDNGFYAPPSNAAFKALRGS